MLLAFIVQMYAIPSEWITGMAGWRVALVTSALAAGALVFRRLAKGEGITLDGLRGWALIALLALAFASQRWSVNPEATRTWCFETLKLAAIYFTVVNVVNTPRRLAVACGVVVIAAAVTAIGAIHWYHVGQDMVEGFRTRWEGVYADPNHLAEDLVLTIPLAVAAIARNRNPWIWRSLCALAATLALVAIIESYSRGGSLGLVAAMAMWAWLEKGRRMRALTLGLAILVGVALFAPSHFWKRESTVNDFQQDASAMGRVYAWEVASRMSVDHPLLGVGAGGFRFAWPLYAPPEAEKALIAHDIYLDFIGELGFVGFILFLVFTGGATAGAFAASVDPEVGWIGRGLAAAVTGYLVCNLFSGDTISAHLYVLFALAAAAGRIAKERSAASAGDPVQPMETARERKRLLEASGG